MLAGNFATLQPALRRKQSIFENFLTAVAARTIAFFKGVVFIELDEEGNPQPSRKRLEKMEREMRELEGEAEQYVLVADRDGFYPCFSCQNGTTIYLTAGQVWRYGVTMKGEKGRYQNTLHKAGLVYTAQCTGTLKKCQLEEKRKIYFYAVHPENLARNVPLIRPPGNKQDN